MILTGFEKEVIIFHDKRWQKRQSLYDQEKYDDIVSEISAISDKMIVSWCINLIAFYASVHIKKQLLYAQILTQLSITEYSLDQLKNASPALIHFLYSKGLIKLEALKSRLEVDDELIFAFSKELGKKPSNWYYNSKFEIENDEVFNDILEYGYPIISFVRLL